ncbi:MAG: ATP-binding cassette domain-containing protein [Armatimonadetes bacterium]|nr:ATP-binding cassette domain-containing protein [Armatimonadota bacterium]
MVSAKDIHLSFGTKEVLRGISLEADAGEIIVIMGSSGGGKTTFIKCIAGLLTPQQGEIEVAGIDVLKESEKAREEMGFVFQYAALFDSLNVADNVLFGLRRSKELRKRDQKKILEELLERLGLAGTENLLPNELSGGMRKRVGMARALCMEPKVLLFDEPTSGLDPVTAFSIDQLIVETRDRIGVTCLVVSHDVSSVLRVADRVAFLHEGEMIFLGTPDDFRGSTQEQLQELVWKSRSETLAPAE